MLIAIGLASLAIAVVVLRRGDAVAPSAASRPAMPEDRDAPRALVLASSSPDAGVRPPSRSRRPPRLPAGLRAADSDAETAQQVEDLAALYRRWNSDGFAELMREGADATALEETLEWFHERLGECGAPEILSVSDEGSIRWVFACAGGELEAEFDIDDDGRVHRLKMGAHRIDPPPEVRAAAEAVLALQRGWNDEVFARVFSDSFERDETRAYIEQFTAQWGLCTLGDVDLGGARGGLLDVACDRGPRLLKVQLDDDDRIVETWFAEPRGY
jgi:hypothetical protein